MKKIVVLALVAVAALAACTPYYPPYPPGPPPPPSYPYPPAPPPMTPRPVAGLGQACGGFAGIQCGDRGAFCQYQPGAQCGAADQTGVCVRQPDFCTREYAPVCGCDGRTYGNACEAAASGASILHPGACY